ncbi:hypothetical protein OEA41_010772 [Lepraria neglecta]|uniref:Major facilitator superfamily (MFS) profile domain-containing protein n=1 Tax=Lepraria neglecta TaxID=209136 RepID=A0AAD9YX76_9LECA|nr:hypothetical protein OEA41_010772 [Lepraria neglecta]
MVRPSAAMVRRKSSTVHYQTFPTPPPKSKGQPPSDTSSSPNGTGHARHASHTSQHDESPLPIKQLVVLAIISLSEQTALNSIGPYLPQMVSTFPDVDIGQVGLYVGLVASSFALAQFATNFFWGWLSDRIGRKPVILTGTLLTAVCFVGFGFVRTLWQAVIVQVLMGLVNGNQGVVSTCLGEITDRSNQSRAFTYLPVIYGLGGITGPVVGGLLVARNARFTKKDPYPYLRPNLVSAVVLVVDLLIAMIFLEESLEEARDLPPLGKRVGNLFSWAWQFASSSRPSYLRIPDVARKPSRHTNGDAAMDDDEEDDSDSDSASQASIPTMLPHHTTDLSHSQVFNRDTVLLMSTYLIFQLSNISYNSLYPIFGQAAPPRGRNLSPEEIGFSLAFAGAATIAFQLGIFGKLREKMGNKITYRVCLAGMVIAFVLTPWVGYKHIENGDGGISSGKGWLWAELAFILLVKSLAAVGCLTSFLLLITNSAPNHSVLGTLNGLAQTLSAAGRAAGPFLAGGLFSLATHVEPKGEALAFGVFGGITVVGFLLSFGIRGKGLEADDWDEEDGSEDGEDDEDEEEHHAR